MSEEELDRIRAIFREPPDAAVASIGGDFSELRGEMLRRFDLVDQRFDVLERRLDRMDNHLEMQ